MVFWRSYNLQLSFVGFFGVLEQLHLQETLCGERHALLNLFAIVFFMDYALVSHIHFFMADFF